MTNGVWSYKLRRNIGYGLVSVDCQVGDEVQVERAGELVTGKLTDIPFREDDR